MESTNRMENMAREIAVAANIRGYEKEIQSIARVDHAIKLASPQDAPWYCPLLIGLGNLLIALGMRLKINSSARAALHSR